jgi:hypothetical protein
VNDWNELRIKNEGSITKKKISEEEDNLLVSRWLNVRQDPIDRKPAKKCNLLGTNREVLS